MKTNYLAYILIFSIVALGVGFSASVLLAQETSGLANIKYPVEELGNCQNEKECRAYCDNPDNGSACLDFAEKNNLMPSEEIKIARKFVSGEVKGPGGCKDKESCFQYCDDISHIDECVAFAEKNGINPKGGLEEAKKIQAAIKKGVKPPACKNKKDCDSYCEGPEHMEECVAFGLEAGFVRGKEAEDAQKMLNAVKRGVKPPPCRGRETCEEYCSLPDNMEVCMNFAAEARFIEGKELEDAQKILRAVKQGIKPPACRGKAECDNYCQQEEHFEECAGFAEAAGFMSAEEAQMARKTGGKGPGGCRGREECKSFCQNPDNQEACFNFAKDNGMIPQEELQRIEEGKQKLQESFNQAPAEVMDCIKGEVGEVVFEKMISGSVPQMGSGEKVGECFQKIMGAPGEGQRFPAGQAGSGGCQNPEECRIYCQNNPEECQKFRPNPGEINPGGQIMPRQSGPEGCKGPEECQKYCESNPDDCKNFQPSSEREKSCEGDDCRLDALKNAVLPCEGENCKREFLEKFAPMMKDGQEQIRKMEQFQQTQGWQLKEQFNKDFQQQYQQQFQQQFQQQYQQMMRQDGQMPLPQIMTQPPQNMPLPQAAPLEQQPIQQLAPQETAPPPPAPTSLFLKVDSFVASALTAFVQFFIGR